MGIKPNYSKSSFEESLKKNLKDFLDAAVSRFFNLGKRAVDISVSDGNYVNRTGVLRSSIGCGVSLNGVLVKSYGFFDFGPDAVEGQRLGKELMERVLSENSRMNQIKLVVVAGAEYASYVESTSDYVVLEPGWDFVESNLPSVLQQLKVI